MSHYTVTVCLPKTTQLEDLEATLCEVLAPFDESTDVTPYRDYLEGSPEEYWRVQSWRDSARNVREKGFIAFAAELTRPELSMTDVTSLQEHLRRCVAADEVLGLVPSWRDVVKANDIISGYNAAVAVIGGDDPDVIDTDRLWYDEKTGQAYTLSTYNPKSKWDWWQIGGRWSGYFVAKNPAAGIIFGEPGVFGKRDWGDSEGIVRCDGGPLELLDFETMRDLAAREAHEDYDVWEQITAAVRERGHDPNVDKSWSYFISRVKDPDDHLDIDEARERYRRQPTIVEERQNHRDRFGLMGPCIIDKFSVSREEYVENARWSAIPTYALLTLDGEWVSPGDMGWFGVSSDEQPQREAYYRRYDEYVASLDPATVLVVVDCHI